jgi:hypothetical protein
MRVRSQIAVLFSALALAALAGPSLALTLSKPGAIAQPTLLHIAARKGTRNYVPGTATALPAAEPSKPEADAKALTDCIAIWDKGTHISKSKWKAICKRQLKERTELSVH